MKTLRFSTLFLALAAATLATSTKANTRDHDVATQSSAISAATVADGGSTPLFAQDPQRPPKPTPPPHRRQRHRRHPAPKPVPPSEG
jgi:hypothetical protein